MNTNPLARLRPRLEQLIEAVLADWDDPTMTGARICARHEITPVQLEAIARLPRFRETLAHLDAIRELRRPHIEARARADLFRSLTAIIHQEPTTASKAKEIRLAIKQLLALTQEPGAGGILPPDRPQGDASYGHDSQSAIPETPPPPMQSADFSTSSPTQAGEVPERGEGGNPEPVTQAPPSLTLRARPEPNPHKPKSPRGYKTRPKAKSR